MLNRTRRIQREIKEEKQEKSIAEKEELIEKLHREVSLLKNELDLAYTIQDDADKNAKLLERLYVSNYIDEEENPMQITAMTFVTKIKVSREHYFHFRNYNKFYSSICFEF